MSPFNEENSVEDLARDLLCGAQVASQTGVVETYEPYITVGRTSSGTGWHFVPTIALPRQPQDVFVERDVREGMLPRPRHGPSATG